MVKLHCQREKTRQQRKKLSVTCVEMGSSPLPGQLCARSLVALAPWWLFIDAYHGAAIGHRSQWRETQL